MRLNKRMQAYRDINTAVTEAYKKHIITNKAYNNALNASYNAWSKLSARQAKSLEIQGRLNSARAGLVRYGANLMQYEAVWGKLKDIARPAIEFESAMADVRKVVEFSPGDEGKREFKKMGQAILDMSTKIPIAAEGLAQIVAAGGQSGIARDDLLKFAESAAKMGVAFDISADQAGEMMAKWRTAVLRQVKQEQHFERFFAKALKRLCTRT